MGLYDCCVLDYKNYWIIKAPRLRTILTALWRGSRVKFDLFETITLQYPDHSEEHVFRIEATINEVRLTRVRYGYYADVSAYIQSESGEYFIGETGLSFDCASKRGFVSLGSRVELSVPCLADHR